MVLCKGCFDNSPRYDSPSLDTGAIHLISLIGLVQEAVAPGEQIDRAMELARIIASNAPLGIRITKTAGRKFIEAGEQAAIDVIPEIKARVLDSADTAEGIQSFVERRAAVFQGR